MVAALAGYRSANAAVQMAKILRSDSEPDIELGWKGSEIGGVSYVTVHNNGHGRALAVVLDLTIEIRGDDGQLTGRAQRIARGAYRHEDSIDDRETVTMLLQLIVMATGRSADDDSASGLRATLLIKRLKGSGAWTGASSVCVLDLAFVNPPAEFAVKIRARCQSTQGEPFFAPSDLERAVTKEW